jgi:hypothetical protein
VTPLESTPPPWRAAAGALWLAIAACAAFLFLPVLDGYFISDDFVPLALFAEWRQHGELAGQLISKFVVSLDAGPNHFYRPLSYLTFGLNFAASGVEPAGWMAVNVVLHLASGVLVAALGVKLSKPESTARAWAAGAAGAAMFLFLAPGGEVVAWISGRFDAMATFFTLAACVAFVSSARRLDAAWWIALASAEAALLSKESAAIMPFAIALLALATSPEEAMGRRTREALLRSAPWLALAALYLVSRYVMFGSATQVYGGSDPVGSAMMPSRWLDGLRRIPAWMQGEFQPARRFSYIAALTLVQVALVLTVERAARLAAACVFAIAVLTVVLLLPHVTALPIGLGGRLFYQTTAFYAMLATIGLVHARLRYLIWGATFGLWIFHVASMHTTIARWSAAYGEMRGLVAQLQAFDRALVPGEFALVIVPAAYDGIPFSRNAQGGLMLPPLFEPADAHHSVVQTNEEIPQLAGKIEGGVVKTLRERSVDDYLAGRALVTHPPEYPTRVACWDPIGLKLTDLDVAPESSPDKYAAGVTQAFARSACSASTDTRSRSSIARRPARAGAE